MNKCYRCAELEGCWAGLHGKKERKTASAFALATFQKTKSI